MGCFIYRCWIAWPESAHWIYDVCSISTIANLSLEYLSISCQQLTYFKVLQHFVFTQNTHFCCFFPHVARCRQNMENADGVKFIGALPSDLRDEKMESPNWWLYRSICPFGKVTFQGLCWASGGYRIPNISNQLLYRRFFLEACQEKHWVQVHEAVRIVASVACHCFHPK